MLISLIILPSFLLFAKHEIHKWVNNKQNNKLRYESFQMKFCLKCVWGPEMQQKEHAKIIEILALNLSCVTLVQVFHVIFMTENIPNINTSN